MTDQEIQQTILRELRMLRGSLETHKADTSRRLAPGGENGPGVEPGADPGPRQYAALYQAAVVDMMGDSIAAMRSPVKRGSNPAFPATFNFTKTLTR